jgi:hypothetical protein
MLGQAVQQLLKSFNPGTAGQSPTGTTSPTGSAVLSPTGYSGSTGIDYGALGALAGGATDVSGLFFSPTEGSNPLQVRS